MLLERYRGRLEYHDPWHLDREVSHLFRGLVDAREVDGVLSREGHGDLRLVDNGVVSRRSPAWPISPTCAATTLFPPGHPRRLRWSSTCGPAASPARGVRDRDSREDLACAPLVDAMWLVANAVERDPSIREAIAAHPNVRIGSAGHGRGVYEAVLSTLMDRAG